MLLLSAFAGAAIILAAVGIYGVISYTVSRRTSEIGLRVALGAKQAEIMRLVLRQALVLAGTGAAIGVVVAMAVTRLLQGLLFGVSTTDGITLVVVPLLLVGVALLAAYVPSRRATRIDPMIALRTE